MAEAVGAFFSFKFMNIKKPGIMQHLNSGEDGAFSEFVERM